MAPVEKSKVWTPGRKWIGHDHCSTTGGNRIRSKKDKGSNDGPGMPGERISESKLSDPGLLGDTSRIDPGLISGNRNVDKIIHVNEPYKKANRLFHPEDTIIRWGTGP